MRNDRTIFYLKLASLISGAIGTALGVLGIKALIEVLPLFSPPKSLQDSINTNAWIEGEVDSDKGFKPASTEDGSKVVYSEYTKKNNHNLALERIEEQKIRRENFHILVGKEKVQVYNNTVNECEQVYEEVEMVDKGVFEWLKTISSIFFMFAISPPFTQDNLVRTTELVIAVNRFYSVFGRLMKTDSGYSIFPSVITKDKKLFLAKSMRPVATCFLISGIALALSFILHKAQKRLSRTKHSIKASKDMTCVICQQNEVKFIMIPCNHLCICQECETVLCPVCEQEVNRKLRVYY